MNKPWDGPYADFKARNPHLADPRACFVAGFVQGANAFNGALYKIAVKARKVDGNTAWVLGQVAEIAERAIRDAEEIDLERD